MKSLSINLSMAEKVKQFVTIVSNYDCDVDLRSGRYVVDAKSILGIFSLDLSKPITVEIQCDKCDELIKELAPFVAK